MTTLEIIGGFLYVIGVLIGIAWSAISREKEGGPDDDGELLFLFGIIVTWPLVLVVVIAALIIALPAIGLDKAHQKLGEFLVRKFKM